MNKYKMKFFLVLIFSFVSLLAIDKTETNCFKVENKEICIKEEISNTNKEYVSIYINNNYIAQYSIKDLKQKCIKYNGNFSILWHNSHFKTKDDKKMFEEILQC